MAVGSAQVTVSTTAVKLSVAEADSRTGESVAITNTDASVTVYVGGAAVTASTGFPLLAGGSLSVDLDGGEALYGVTASGSVTVGVLRTSI